MTRRLGLAKAFLRMNYLLLVSLALMVGSQAVGVALLDREGVEHPVRFSWYTAIGTVSFCAAVTASVEGGIQLAPKQKILAALLAGWPVLLVAWLGVTWFGLDDHAATAAGLLLVLLAAAGAWAWSVYLRSDQA